MYDTVFEAKKESKNVDALYTEEYRRKVILVTVVILMIRYDICKLGLKIERKIPKIPQVFTLMIAKMVMILD